MLGLRNKVIAFVAVGIFVAIGLFINSRQVTAQQGPPDGLSVRITNSSTNPVPVQDVDNAARRPFQTTLCVSFGSQVCTPPKTYSVPNDRRLVIEYASGLCPPSGTSLPVGLNVTGALLTTVAGGTTATHLFKINQGLAIGVGGTRDLNGFSVAELTRIYADKGTNVTLDLDVGGLGPNGSIKCSITISGYTVTP